MMSPTTVLSHPALRAAALALVVALGATGCDHVTDPDGPNLTDRFGEFNFVEPVEASQPTVDFAGGEDVVFTATFSKQAEWVLEITGQESGAVKRIEGFSNALDATNATWNGTTTELPFFKDEPVDVALFAPGEESDTLRTTVEVLSARVYPGNVAADFEGNEDIFFGNFEFELDEDVTGISDEVPAAEGDFFYLFRSRGIPTIADPFFIGLIDITPGGGVPLFEVPTTVPEELYFNFFIRGFGTPNTIAVIQVIADGNGTGNYEIDQDTEFPLDNITVDFTGWRAFSTPVSALGMTQEQAGEIVAVRIVVISDDNNQPDPPLPVDFGLDYITFTAGGPLEL